MYALLRLGIEFGISPTNTIQMKTHYFFLLITIVLFSNRFQAQSTGSAIYLTATDFEHQKTTHQTKHTRIKLHDVIKKDFIEVKVNDTIYKYSKNEIFGYRDTEGNQFRMYQGNIYPILNPGEKIVIYKVTGAPVQKGQLQTYSYYFSADASKEILPLTLYHLEHAFADSKEFTSMLEIHFSSANGLLEYDSTHHMYKISRFLELAQNR